MRHRAAARGLPSAQGFVRTMRGAALGAFLAAAAPAAAAPEPPPGAASCSGCHATSRPDAVMVPLAGLSPEEIGAAMQAYRAGQRQATVMDRIARGFSDAEIEAIAAWIGAQGRGTP